MLSRVWTAVLALPSLPMSNIWGCSQFFPSCPTSKRYKMWVVPWTWKKVAKVTHRATRRRTEIPMRTPVLGWYGCVSVQNVDMDIDIDTGVGLGVDRYRYGYRCRYRYGYTSILLFFYYTIMKKKFFSWSLCLHRLRHPEPAAALCYPSVSLSVLEPSLQDHLWRSNDLSLFSTSWYFSMEKQERQFPSCSQQHDAP